MLTLKILIVTLPLISGPVLENPHGKAVFGGDTCRVCHVGHGAPGTPMLPADEKDTCLGCHSTKWNVLKKSLKSLSADELELLKPPHVASSFDKPYRHPVGEAPLRGYKSLKCSDCHDPHRMKVAIDVKPGERKPNPKIGMGYEYELCFLCHTESQDLPPTFKDKRLEFENMRSFHPVVIVRPSGDVPSLKPPLYRGAFINCTDCHGSDNLSEKGIHGSAYPHILKYPYEEEDGTPEGEYTYSLCYQCHDRISILRDESFPYHSLHVEKGRISCNSCHDPHGAPNPWLIRFREEGFNPVEPSSSGRLLYESYGPRSGACFLKCHGVDHNPARY